MSTLQSTLNKLMKVSSLPPEGDDNIGKKQSLYSQQIHISESKGNAHLWSIYSVSKYLSEVVELPQYVDIFKAYEISGMSFISMPSPSAVSGSCGGEIVNNLHLLKISSHSQQLMKLVLEREGVGLDKRVKDGMMENDWTTLCITAWIKFCSGIKDVSDEAIANLIRSSLTGRDLVLMDDSNIFKLFPVHSTLAKGLTSLRSLLIASKSFNMKKLEKHKLIGDKSRDSDPEELVVLVEESPKEIKKKKRVTAMSTRRAKQNVLQLEPEQDDQYIHEENRRGAISEPDEDIVKQLTGAKGEVMSPIEEEMSDNEISKVSIEETVSAISPLKEGPLKEEVVTDSHEMKKITKSKRINNKKKKKEEKEKEKEEEEPVGRSNEEDEMIKSYKSERKQFLHRISELNKVVQASSQSISDLRVYSRKLKLKEQHDRGGDREIIRALRADRDIAIQELEKVVHLYRSQSLAEKKQLSNEVMELLGDKRPPPSPPKQQMDIQYSSGSDEEDDSDLELPLSNNRRTPPSPPSYNRMTSGRGGAAAPPLQSAETDHNLLNLLEVADRQQKEVFQQLLTYYRAANPLPNGIHDTRDILHHVATSWTNLGLKMLGDSRKGGEEGLDGMRRCCAALLSPHPDNTNTNTTTNNDQSVAAIGLVFLLGVVSRIIQPQLQLQPVQLQLQHGRQVGGVLLNQITDGTLPISRWELSRDDLRDLLQTHLGMHLSWDEFDSMWRRIRNERKKSVVTVHELIDDFQSIPNQLQRSQGEVDMQVVHDLMGGRPKPSSRALNSIRKEVLSSPGPPSPSPSYRTRGDLGEDLHFQRRQMLSEYLERLNGKAVRKKKILHALLSLWQAAKASSGLFPSIVNNSSNNSNNNSSITSSNSNIKRSNNITSITSSNSMDIKMSPADILSKTRNIQQELLGDIQERPTTKHSLVTYTIQYYYYCTNTNTLIVILIHL